jgi:hypothetical protein
MAKGAQESAAVIHDSTAELAALQPPPSGTIRSLEASAAGFLRLAARVSKIKGEGSSSVPRNDFQVYDRLSAAVGRSCRVARQAGPPA